MNSNTEFVWLVGGPAGAGVKKTGEIFARTLMRGGYYVFVNSEYPSLIRGGHNSEKVTAKAVEVYAQSEKLNILVALDGLSVRLHLDELKPNGIVIYDKEKSRISDEEITRNDLQLIDVPLSKFARDLGRRDVLKNSVAVGASLAVIDYDIEILKDVLKRTFKASVAEINIKAAEIGYYFVKEKYGKVVSVKLPTLEKKSLYLLKGNEAIALGALKAGTKFYAGYPMTPSTSILQTFASFQKDFDVVTIQSESELAAINMVIGAAAAGVRAMTGTSGGGFSLMVEALGFAAMSEVPVVIALVQRPGPSTGLPTRTAQADLRFALHASQGEFPRFVIAPGDVEECFYHTMIAHNLAEKFQVPAIIISDKYLGESAKSIPWFESNKIPIERGKLLDDKTLEVTNEPATFKRYELTDDGISTRAFYGQKVLVKLTGNEHDEYGYTADNPQIGKDMADKRWKKFPLMEKEMQKYDPIKVYGSPTSDITLIFWGSTKGPVLEAKRKLEEKGYSVNAIQVVFLSPFPTENLRNVLKNAQNVVLVEQNKTAQLGSLIREHLLLDIPHKYLKYDGWPIEAIDLVEYVEHEVL